MALADRFSRFRLLAHKGLKAAPEFVLHPNQLLHAVRGVHWATLNTLDQPWIRCLAIDTVIDVGANTGQFATASRVVFPTARIYSFEPLPECHFELQKRMGHDPNFRSFNIALGAEITNSVMHKSSFVESSSLLTMSDIHKQAFPWTGDHVDIPVPVATLDSMEPELITGPNTLLKIDVQGYELFVLQGAAAFLQRVSLVLVEVSFAELYEHEPSFNEVDSFLRNHGFSFHGMLDQLVDPHAKMVLQGDAIYMRRGKSTTDA